MVEETKHSLDREINNLKITRMTLHVKPELLLYQFRTEVCKRHLMQSREKQLLSFPLWARYETQR